MRSLTVASWRMLTVLPHLPPLAHPGRDSVGAGSPVSLPPRAKRLDQPGNLRGEPGRWLNPAGWTVSWVCSPSSSGKSEDGFMSRSRAKRSHWGEIVQQAAGRFNASPGRPASGGVHRRISGTMGRSTAVVMAVDGGLWTSLARENLPIIQCATLCRWGAGMVMPTCCAQVLWIE